MSATFYREAYTPKEIVAGDFPLVTKSVTIAAGQVLKRGAVLGKVAASGKLVLSASAATDGSQVPYAILANEEVDASAADTGATVYLTGQFLGKNLTFGTSHSADTVREGLRAVSIFIQ